MNRKKIFGLLAITIVVAAIGPVAALGGKFPGIDPQSRDIKQCHNKEIKNYGHI